MKSKAKLSKHKNKVTAQTPNVPAEWFYMCEHDITVNDIRHAYEDSGELTGTSVEIWEEAGVLEIEIEDQRSFVMEHIEADLHDEYSNEFLSKHQVKALFAVTIDPENYDMAKKIMGRIAGGLDGFFCADTMDFRPIL